MTSAADIWFFVVAMMWLIAGVCIYYEHKALGFMTQLGLQDLAFDIREVDSARLCRAVDEVLERDQEIRALLRERVPKLRDRARHTTRLAAELLRQQGARRRAT